MRKCWEILGKNPENERCKKCPVTRFDDDSAYECWLFAASHCKKNGLMDCVECKVYKENGGV